MRERFEQLAFWRRERIAAHEQGESDRELCYPGEVRHYPLPPEIEEGGLVEGTELVFFPQVSKGYDKSILDVWEEQEDALE
jgi:hypothetical protein